MAEKPNILIGIPAYGGTPRTECTLSLIWLASKLTENKIPFTPVFTNHFDLPESRNFLASLCLLSDKKFSHALFCDSDVGFSPQVIADMLRVGKPVVGCAVPLRSETTRPVFNVVDPRPTDTENLVQVSHVGAAIILIERTALEKLQPTVRRQDKHGFRITHRFNSPIYGFFDRIETADDLYGEDLSFCERWRKSGGEIFAIAGHEITHTGTVAFRATYQSPTTVSRELVNHR